MGWAGRLGMLEMRHENYAGDEAVGLSGTMMVGRRMVVESSFLDP